MDYLSNQPIDFLIIKFLCNTFCLFTADMPSFYHCMNSGNSISETYVMVLNQMCELRYFKITVVFDLVGISRFTELLHETS